MTGQDATDFPGPRREQRATSGNQSQARSEQTRLVLLQSGMAALLTEPARGVFAHLTAQRVATLAGRTTGAFFHQWPTLEDYRRDLLRFVLAPEQALTWQRILDTAPRVGEADPVRVLLGLGRRALASTPEDAQTLLEVLIWIRGIADPQFRAEVAGIYPPLDEVGAGYFDALLRDLGRQARPPFSPLGLALVVSALTQGLSVRRVLTPQVLDDDVLGQVLIALLPGLTRRPGDDRDVEAWVRDSLDG